MEFLKTLHVAHLPIDMPVHVALFTQVTNAGFLRQQLLDGNTDFEYAFLDASSVCVRLYLGFQRSIRLNASDLVHYAAARGSLQSSQ